MRLTRYTDYTLRVLIYLAARPDRVCAISEMSQAYGVSQNHLMKVVHELGKAGYVTGVRGRFGGIRLARPPRRSMSAPSFGRRKKTSIWFRAELA